MADATQDLCKEKTQGAEGMGKGCEGKVSMGRKEDEEAKERDKRCRVRKMRRTSGPSMASDTGAGGEEAEEQPGRRVDTEASD